MFLRWFTAARETNGVLPLPWLLLRECNFSWGNHAMSGLRPPEELKNTSY